MANQFGESPSFVTRNFEEFERREAREKIREFRRQVERNPTLKAWITNPENAALAQIDFDPLSRISRTMENIRERYGEDTPYWKAVTEIPESFLSGTLQLEQSYYGLQAVFGGADPDAAAKNYADASRRIDDIRRRYPSYRKEWDRVVQGRAEDFNDRFQKFLGSWDDLKEGNILGALRGYFVDGALTGGNALGMIWDGMITRPRGFLSFSAQMVPTVAPVIATSAVMSKLGAMAGGLVGPGGAVIGGFAAGMAGAFTSGAAVNAGDWISQALSSRGYNLSDPESMREAFRDPKLISEIRAEALRNGITYGAVEALALTFAGHAVQAAKVKAAAQGLTKVPRGALLRAGAREAVEQAGVEFTSEAAAQFAALGNLRDVNFGEAAMEALGSLGHTVGTVAVGVSIRSRLPASPLRAAVSLAGKTKEAVRAIADAKQLDEIGQAVRESRSIKDSPAEVARFIEVADLMQSREAGKSRLYFRVSEWDQVWAGRQRSGHDEAVSILADAGTEYLRARESDGLIEVPLATFISRLAQDEGFNPLVQIARARPDGPSFVESMQFMQSLPPTMEDVAAEAMAGQTAELLHPGLVERAKRIATPETFQIMVDSRVETGATPEDAEQGAAREALEILEPEALRPTPPPTASNVAKQVAAQILATGRLKPEEAMTVAKISRGIKVLSERSGISMEDFLAKYPIPEILREAVSRVGGESLEQQARGVIQFFKSPERIQTVIALLKDADVTTFVHEMGHFYLQVLGDIASQPMAALQIVEDHKAALDWLGAKKGEALTVEQQEKWAKGFEVYFMTSRAPTTELRGVFHRIGQWMRLIYKTIKSLGVAVNSEVRGVMDRILATDDEIAAALDEPGADEMFADGLAVGMTEKQARDYANAKHRAYESALEQLVPKQIARIMQSERGEMRRLRGGFRRDAKAIIDSLPAYQARAVVVEASVKRNDLVNEAIRDGFKWLGLHAVGPSHRYWTTAYSIDEIAEDFGFDSTQSLIRALWGLPSKEKAVDAMVEMMVNEHIESSGENSLEEIENQAVAAVNNEHAEARRRLEHKHMLSKEFKAFANLTEKLAIKPLPPSEEVQRQARASIREVPAGRLRPAVFKSQAFKAGRAAMDAVLSGKYEEAADFKREEVFAVAKFKAAIRARDEIATTLAQADKIHSEEFQQILGRAGIGPGVGDAIYIDVYNGIVSEFHLSDIAVIRGMAVRGSFSRIGELAARIQSIDHRFHGIPDLASEGITPKPYKDLTVGQLQRVNHAMVAVEAAARNLDRAYRLGKAESFRAAVDAVSGNLGENVKVGWTGKLREFLEGNLMSSVFTVDTLAEIATSDEDARNPVHHHLVRPIHEAVATVMEPRLDRMGEEAETMLRKYYPTDKEVYGLGRKNILVPELGVTLSKNELLSMAQLRGSEGVDALLKAVYQFGEKGPKALKLGMIDAALRNLDARDWEYVKDRWAYFEAFRDEIVATHLRRTGLKLELVESVPFTAVTKDGQEINLPGGYWPLRYERGGTVDASNSTDPDINASTGLIEFMSGSWAMAQTSHAYRKARVGSNGEAVRLDGGVFFQELRARIVDLSIGDEIMYVGRLLYDPTVKDAFLRSGNDGFRSTLSAWVDDTAVGQRGPSNAVEKGFRWVRAAGSVSKVGWNAVTHMLQLLGVLPAMVKVGKRNALLGIAEYLRNPVETTKTVYGMSEALKRRGLTMHPDFEDTQRLMNETRWLDVAFEEAGIPRKFTRMFKASFFAGIIKLQSIADVMTFLGAMRKHVIDDGMSREDAIYASTRDIDEIYSSPIWSSRTGVERGTWGTKSKQQETIRMFSFLMAPMIRKFNMGYSGTIRAGRSIIANPIRTPAEIANWALDMTLLFGVESMIVLGIRGAWPDEDDDEDIGTFALRQMGREAASSVPVLREIADAMSDPGYQVRAGGAWGAFVGMLDKSPKEIPEEGITLQFIKRINEPASFFLGYPGVQTNRVLDAILRNQRGEDVPAREIIFGRPPKR